LVPFRASQRDRTYQPPLPSPHVMLVAIEPSRFIVMREKGCDPVRRSADAVCQDGLFPLERGFSFAARAATRGLFTIQAFNGGANTHPRSPLIATLRSGALWRMLRHRKERVAVSASALLVSATEGI